MIMLPLDFVLATLVGLSMFIGYAESKPAPYYSVTLKHCGATTSNSSIAERCASACTSVMLAQSSCYGVPACTCTSAPAESIKACLECRIREEPQGLDEEAILTITSKVTAYSLICDSLLDTHTSRDDLKLDIPSSTNNTKRETEERLCLFGLPDIIFPEPSTFATSNYRNPWLYLVFAVVVILFVAESRLRSSRS